MKPGGIAQCPVDECGGTRAYFYMVQIRSADEPMTTFYKVCSLPLSFSFLLVDLWWGDGIDKWDGGSVFLVRTSGGRIELSCRYTGPCYTTAVVCTKSLHGDS